MRRWRVISVLMALILATGCVYDRLTPEEACPGPAQKYYLSVVLHPQGETAAVKATGGSFKKADLEEMLVAHADFYFYTYEGKWLCSRHVTGLDQEEQPEGSAVESLAGAQTMTLDVRPYRMLATANLTAAAASALEGKDLDEARALVSTMDVRQGTTVSVEYKGTPVDLHPFPMTASTYMSNVGREICDVVISEYYLKEDPVKAQGTPLEVYLERLAAKVTLSLPALEFDVPVVTAENNISAKVKVTGWGLNATNKSSYCFKKIRSSWNNDFSWTWKNEIKGRCYWAEDPNYTSGTYPVLPASIQSEDALEYVAYKDLGNTLALDEGRYKGSLYCRENTADGALLPLEDGASASLYSRITHVLVKAELVFSLASGTDVKGYVSASDIYRYKGVFYASLAEAQAVEAVSPGGRIDHFKKGQFYYKIPIEHLNDTYPSSGNSYNTANYGVVRNHNYTITVSGLSGIGMGISQEDERILPVRDASDYQVSVYTTVSPWQQLLQEFVFVDPSGVVQTNGQQVENWNDSEGWYE